MVIIEDLYNRDVIIETNKATKGGKFRIINHDRKRSTIVCAF